MGKSHLGLSSLCAEILLSIMIGPFMMSLKMSFIKVERRELVSILTAVVGAGASWHLYPLPPCPATLPALVIRDTSSKKKCAAPLTASIRRKLRPRFMLWGAVVAVLLPRGYAVLLPCGYAVLLPRGYAMLTYSKCNEVLCAEQEWHTAMPTCKLYAMQTFPCQVQVVASTRTCGKTARSNMIAVCKILARALGSQSFGRHSSST
jgi:hypothetical protein